VIEEIGFLNKKYFDYLFYNITFSLTAVLIVFTALHFNIVWFSFLAGYAS